MPKWNRNLPLAIALAACTAAPAAFAQDAQQAPTRDDNVAQEQQAGEQGNRKSWAELDADGNGTLSKAEAASMESLAQIFDKADADADGELSQDEYKAWLGANAQQDPPGGG